MNVGACNFVGGNGRFFTMAKRTTEKSTLIGKKLGTQRSVDAAIYSI